MTNVETKYGIAPRLHAGERAAETAVDDGACMCKLDALPAPAFSVPRITNSSKPEVNIDNQVSSRF